MLSFLLRTYLKVENISGKCSISDMVRLLCPKAARAPNSNALFPFMLCHTLILTSYRELSRGVFFDP